VYITETTERIVGVTGRLVHGIIVVHVKKLRSTDKEQDEEMKKQISEPEAKAKIEYLRAMCREVPFVMHRITD